MSLPPSAADQKYVTVSAIDGGSITLPDRFFISPAEPTASRTVPSLSFLVTHPGADPNCGASSSHHLLFDLGLRGRAEDYTTSQQAHLQTRTPYRLGPNVRERLEAAGVLAEDIRLIIYSHVHYDHTGDPADFPRARFLIGAGALAVLQHGLSGAGSHQHFDPKLLPVDRTEELPPVASGGPWRKLGPFDAALDLFDDGSVFVINAPGHLPGHVNLLCRTGKDRWIYLAGDTFHDRRLLTGEKQIGTWETGEGENQRTLCIHLDRETAAATIAKVAAFAEIEGTQVIAAHDNEWLEWHRDRLLPHVIE